MATADHIFVDRGFYCHHGLDMGDGTVVHFTGEVLEQENAAVRRTSMAVFLNGGTLQTIRYARSLPPDEVVERATSRLNERGYSLVFRNCEHFAMWAKLGDWYSQQVDRAATTSGAAIGAGAATAAGLGAVSAGGVVAGLSGPGIMSGLAAAGGVVGGGAVAGLSVLAAGPTAVTTVAMNHVLRDDDRLCDEERSARAAGRAATAIGAVGGGVASIGAVSVAGVAGLSGAGITSGLAAIGATVGGGMAAGTAITVAAPAVAAAAIGYGVYRAASWLLE